jgi:hypothetical protein
MIGDMIGDTIEDIIGDMIEGLSSTATWIDGFQKAAS